MTSGDASREATVNKALARAGGHPVGFAALRVLAELGTASGKEIAARVSKPRSTVGDQLRRLEEEGLIECVGEETKRGTIERFYRLTPSARWLDDGEMGQLSAVEKRRMGLRTVRSILTDASAALGADTLDHRDDWCLSSLRVIVDCQGWRELAEIHRRAVEEVERVRGESAERLSKETGGAPLRALSSLMLLELPQE